MDRDTAPAELTKQKADASAATEATPVSNPVNSVYDTAEFHIYVRKVISCSKRFAHEWTTCPFAHPGEKAKRRDPRTHQYDCEMCPTVAKGEVCELGAACPHSHHVFESWLHPQKFRTMLCKDGEACHREVCFFAHGAEQLRVPSRDLPHMPLAGPSRLRRQIATRQEQDELARQASTGVVAAVGNSYGMLPSPQAAALSAAMAAAQFNARGAGCGNSGGRHVWFAPLQQTRALPSGQQGATCNMIMSGSCSNVLPAPAAGGNPGMQGGAVSVLPYADSMAGLSGAAVGDPNRLQASGTLASTGNNSGSGWAMSLLTGQQDGDSRRSSLCESCTSSMMIVPTMLQTVPLNSTEQLAGGALHSAAATQQQGAAGSANVLGGVNDINVLLSSLVQEIKTTRQEAADSRNAAAQAQEQLRAITSALAGTQSTAMLDTAAPAATLTGAMPSGLTCDAHGTAAGAEAAVGDSTNKATQDQLQQGSDPQRGIMGDAAVLSALAGADSLPDQLALLQQLQSVGLMPSDLAATSLNSAVSGDASMLMGLQQIFRDGSNMSTSGSWRIAPGGVLSRIASAGAALAPTAVGRRSFETARAASSDHAGLPRGGSLDQATAAAAAAMAAASLASTGVSGMSCQASGMPAGANLMPSSYPIAVGNASTASVMDWLQLLPAASGIDAAAATAAGLMPQLPNWRNSMEHSSRANAASSGSAAMVGISSSNNSMQQQQSQSDYLLQLQRTHGLLTAPELALFAPTGPAQARHELQQQQQQQYQMQSAAAVLQGWGRCDVQDCVNSSGTMEGLISPSQDVAANLTATGGARQLGWL